LVSFFALKRVRVTRGNSVAYDEQFHRGVNIIRGENSSGKSTISDFIFYGLGGDFDRWKDAAAQCSAVRLEIETEQSVLTIHRSVGSKQEPTLFFYGGLEDSLFKGIDNWQRVPIRRPPSGKDLSFTQILFRAAGIPEAPNVDNSNVTMHQILRLLYSDQQTPAGKLFRFESFDTRDSHSSVVGAMRGAVLGDADVVLTIGRRLDFQLAYGSPAVFQSAKFVRIADTPAEMRDNRRGAVEILASPAERRGIHGR
jgi:hypothetical protein